MRNNNQLKGKRREDRKRNNSKMIVRGRSIFTLVRAKMKKGKKQ